jgi:anti-sigma28 factor (negative regulator of flagellin synthesis)
MKIKIKMKEAAGYRLKVGPDFRAGRVEKMKMKIEDGIWEMGYRVSKFR